MLDEEYVQKLVEINKMDEAPICWFFSHQNDCVYRVDFNSFSNEKYTLGNPDWEHDLKNWLGECVEELQSLDFEDDSVWIYEDLKEQLIEEVQDYQSCCKSNVDEAKKQVNQKEKELKKAMNLELYLNGKLKFY